MFAFVSPSSLSLSLSLSLCVCVSVFLFLSLLFSFHLGAQSDYYSVVVGLQGDGLCAHCWLWQSGASRDVARGPPALCVCACVRVTLSPCPSVGALVSVLECQMLGCCVCLYVSPCHPIRLSVRWCQC